MYLESKHASPRIYGFSVTWLIARSAKPFKDYSPFYEIFNLYVSNLVDPASSHTLVSKIKPCMSKYKQFIQRNCEWLIISVIIYLIVLFYLDNRSNSRANTCVNTGLLAER